MKPNVLLDLDNTLVYSVPLSTVYKYPSLRKHYFEDIVILERPFLTDFLKTLGQYFNVSVWTAARSDYANFIVKNILVPHVVIFYLFDRHQVQDSLHYFGTMKNLDLLTKIYKIPMFIDHKNILVDDLVEICQQKNPCLNVVPFNGKKDDMELLFKLNDLIERF